MPSIRQLSVICLIHSFALAYAADYDISGCDADISDWGENVVNGSLKADHVRSDSYIDRPNRRNTKRNERLTKLGSSKGISAIKRSRRRKVRFSNPAIPLDHRPLDDNQYYGPDCDTTKLGHPCRFARVCGQFHQNHLGGYVIHGQMSGSRDWPCFVQVLIVFGNETYACSGSLITDQHVITAAHCLEDDGEHSNETPVVFLLLGVSQSGVTRTMPELKRNGVIVREGAKICRHPDHAMDIVIVLLDKKVEFSDRIKPACYPYPFREHSTNNKTCFAAGLGMTEQPRKGTRAKWAMGIKHIPVLLEPLPDNSSDYINNLNTIPINNIHYTGGLDALCFGDSGGPVMCRQSGRSWMLQGVISEGNKSCSGYAQSVIPDIRTALLTSNECAPTLFNSCRASRGENGICRAQYGCGINHSPKENSHLVVVSNGESNRRCLGAIISETVIITSLECTYNMTSGLELTTKQIQVQPGPFPLTGPADELNHKKILVDRIDRHQSANKQDLHRRHHLAMLVLRWNITEPSFKDMNLIPLCWPYSFNSHVDEQSSCKVIGFRPRIQWDGVEIGKSLAEVPVRIVPCVKYARVEPDNSCWKRLETDSNGQSESPLSMLQLGNPIVCLNQDNKMTLAAVVVDWSVTEPDLTKVLYASNINPNDKDFSRSTPDVADLLDGWDASDLREENFDRREPNKVKISSRITKSVKRKNRLPRWSPKTRLDRRSKSKRQ